MRDSDSSFFDRQCAAIRRRAPMTEQHERELAEAWMTRRDRRAAEALVEAHLPVVIRLANRLRGYGVPRDELVAEGNVGLLRAVEKFDLRGVRFKTYATYWIRAYMLACAMRSNSIVTAATGALGASFFFKLRSARARAEALMGPGHDGIDALLAEQFGVSEDVIRHHTARLAAHDVSLDVAVSEDGETSGLDLLPGDDASPEDALGALERDELVHSTVHRVARGLDERERAVLFQRLLSENDDVTLSDLGDRFSLSRERLRQIEARVKQRLRRALDTVSPEVALHA